MGAGVAMVAAEAVQPSVRKTQRRAGMLTSEAEMAATPLKSCWARK